jgi:glucose/arabinose dehydrogenase
MRIVRTFAHAVHCPGGISSGTHHAQKSLIGNVDRRVRQALRPAAGRPDRLPGFLTDKDETRGRPVGVHIDKQGALLWPTMSATRSGA